MRQSGEHFESIAALFREQPCWTIDSLAASLEYSVPSVRRFLSRLGYFSSFTHNGAWYTLVGVPKFGRDGLWFHRDIGFSKAGSLADTIVSLVDRSPEGMSAGDLERKLRGRCHSVLVALCRKNRLRRFKAGRSFVYVSADAAAGTRQREKAEAGRLPEESLPAEIAVLVLAEHIRRPESDFAQLAASMARRGVYVDASRIHRLFDLHGLKKKT